MVREARPEELPSIGALRVAAYERGGFLRPGDPYAGTLRALGRQGDGTVLVAEDGGRLLGTIMLAARAATELAGTAGAADIRAWPSRRAASPRGCAGGCCARPSARAAAAGVHRLLLSTQPTMRAAHSTNQKVSVGHPSWTGNRSRATPCWSTRRLSHCGRVSAGGRRAGRKPGSLSGRGRGGAVVHGVVRGRRGIFFQLPAQGAEQKVQGDAHPRDDEEPEHTRCDVIVRHRSFGQHRAGQRRSRSDRHRHTLSRTPANKSSSGSSVSTSDLAR